MSVAQTSEKKLKKAVEHLALANGLQEHRRKATTYQPRSATSRTQAARETRRREPAEQPDRCVLHEY